MHTYICTNKRYTRISGSSDADMSPVLAKSLEAARSVSEHAHEHHDNYNHSPDNTHNQDHQNNYNHSPDNTHNQDRQNNYNHSPL